MSPADPAAQSTSRAALHTLIAVSVIGMAALACNISTSGVSGPRPAVLFLAPDNNSTLAEGATIQIAVSAQDPNGAGVARVDFSLDSVPIGSQKAPNAAGQPELIALQVWTAHGAQGHLISAAAYRADNSPVGDAALTVNVVTLPTTPGAATAAATPLPTFAPYIVVTVPDQPTPTASITTVPILTAPSSGITLAATLTAIIATPTPPVDGVPAQVVTAYLNVRSGPGTTYPVIGSIKANETVTIIGRNSDHSWWAIQGSDVRGWIINTPAYLKINGDISKVGLASYPPSPVPTAIAPTPIPALAPTSTR